MTDEQLEWAAYYVKRYWREAAIAAFYATFLFLPALRPTFSISIELSL